jgi:SAM-dependent methyltransferase
MNYFCFCPICKLKTLSRIVPVYAKRLQLPAKHQVVKCSCCRISRLEPQPSEDSAGNHYDESSYYAVEAYEARAEKKIPLFKERLQKIEALLDHPNSRAILDFGCAGGHFLELAIVDGWSAFGIEISTQLAASATARIGNPVFESIGDAVSSLYESLDAVHANHSLEHVKDAMATIKGMRDLLHPGGILVIEVPYQFGSWIDLIKIALIRLFGENKAFRFFKPPADSLHHLFFFTPASLRRLLEKSGFKVERLSTVNRFYRLPTQRSGYRNALFRMLDTLFATIDKGSVIEIFARKIQQDANQC